MASLRDLGLSEYEARAYRALLKTGPTTAKELSRVSDVPMGRIYDVLNSIEQYNLVRSQSASRPKKYVAVEPSTALDRLLEDKKRELDEKANQYESIVDELSGELETAEPVEDTFWTAAVGPDETVDLLMERISAADSEVVMVLSSYIEQFFDIDTVGTLILDELTDAMDRGVDVRLLMRPEVMSVLPESIGERYRTSLTENERFTVCISEDVTGTFTLIDDNEVTIEVPHPLKNREVFAMIDLKDREFAQSVRSEFEPRWEQAEELTF
ncbi:TrmB family transcription regulator [Natronomonas pharaonis DSM 2160]|uniref:TrmB family transcription regulator n=1 Tax=Natronomonas pharaonis (strain ATCC 35678 / DSM 2160 / CIP 103997 / JCM 8858 / NBRC 14720 / NCIMB 2260 / Gabara) TaxID=348780 RepID=A0A1U7EW79_NATPD|nr:TrmB family transcriptional regulator [Natronomonas pharaonis]CAI49350.1 TrmB family transcription regulator [Natronomonas pharaonis DSM 2160]